MAVCVFKHAAFSSLSIGNVTSLILFLTAAIHSDTEAETGLMGILGNSR